MSQNSILGYKIAVVIPCYKVKKHILKLIESIPNLVTTIYVVDDKCPESSGDFVEKNCQDARLKVLKNPINLGVGGAVMTGYKHAVQDGMDIVVKVDGDGQMDPSLIPYFVEPITSLRADYTKGNRFYNLDKISRMPFIRILGNAILSIFSKVSSGYWQIFDPTNGYTAIHTKVIELIPLDKVSRRYFFESDLLFRLNCVRAAVEDVSMDPKYEDEVSNLKISNIVGEFLTKHFRNSIKRVFYNYFLRDVSAASVEFLIGGLLVLFGVFFGIESWFGRVDGSYASSGTVMLAALPIILGIQFLLAFVNFDVANQPKTPVWPKLQKRNHKYN